MDIEQKIRDFVDSSGASYSLGVGAITLSQVVDFADVALKFLTLVGGCVVIWHRFYLDRLKAKKLEDKDDT